MRITGSPSDVGRPLMIMTGSELANNSADNW